MHFSDNIQINDLKVKVSKIVQFLQPGTSVQIVVKSNDREKAAKILHSVFELTLERALEKGFKVRMDAAKAAGKTTTSYFHKTK
jgi:translation initiation factor IF-3